MSGEQAFIRRLLAFGARPIATAPKDGSRFMAYYPGLKDPTLGFQNSTRYGPDNHIVPTCGMISDAAPVLWWPLPCDEMTNNTTVLRALRRADKAIHTALISHALNGGRNSAGDHAAVATRAVKALAMEIMGLQQKNRLYLLKDETMDNIETTVLTVFSNQIDIPIEELQTQRDNTWATFKLDELDIVELTMALEEELSISLSEESIEHAGTINKLIEYVRLNIEAARPQLPLVE